MRYKFKSMVTTNNRWWIFGLFWGAFMFVFQQVLWPISEGEVLTFRRLLLGFLYWEVVGLFLGWIIYFIEQRRKPTKAKS